VNLEDQQKQLAEQQAEIEKVNAARRRATEAEATATAARREAEQAAAEADLNARIAGGDGNALPLWRLNQHAGPGSNSPARESGVEIDGQSARALNPNANT
jgi:sRNA-binding protein